MKLYSFAQQRKLTTSSGINTLHTGSRSSWLLQTLSPCILSYYQKIEEEEFLSILKNARFT